MVDLVVDIIPIVTIVTVMLMPNYVMPFKKVNVIVDQVADSVMVIQVLEEGLFQIIVLVQEVLVEMVFVLLFNVVNVTEAVIVVFLTKLVKQLPTSSVVHTINNAVS